MFRSGTSSWVNRPARLCSLLIIGGSGAGHVAAVGNDDHILSLADGVLPAVKDGPGRHLPVGFLADLPDDARERILAELELAAGPFPFRPFVFQQQDTLGP